jgi:hypothetical protein
MCTHNFLSTLLLLSMLCAVLFGMHVPASRWPQPFVQAVQVRDKAWHRVTSADVLRHLSHLQLPPDGELTCGSLGQLFRLLQIALARVGLQSRHAAVRISTLTAAAGAQAAYVAALQALAAAAERAHDSALAFAADDGSSSSGGGSDAIGRGGESQRALLSVLTRTLKRGGESRASVQPFAGHAWQATQAASSARGVGAAERGSANSAAYLEDHCAQCQDAYAAALAEAEAIHEVLAQQEHEHRDAPAQPLDWQLISSVDVASLEPGPECAAALCAVWSTIATATDPSAAPRSLHRQRISITRPPLSPALQRTLGTSDGLASDAAAQVHSLAHAVRVAQACLQLACYGAEQRGAAEGALRAHTAAEQGVLDAAHAAVERVRCRITGWQQPSCWPCVCTSQHIAAQAICNKHIFVHVSRCSECVQT